MDVFVFALLKSQYDTWPLFSQPILRIRASLKEMKSGEVLQVIATDPGSVRDIETFCNQTDNTLLSLSKVAGEYIFDPKILE